MIGLSKKLPPVSSISVSKIAVGMSAELITRRLFFVRFLPSSLKIGGGTKEREEKTFCAGLSSPSSSSVSSRLN